MRITIGQRLRPYSHLPGTYLLLPGTTTRMQVFPTRVIYEDLSGPFPKHIKTVDYPHTGPVRDFTVQQDLERGRVLVWGHAQAGHFKTFEEGSAPKVIERLSLGSHKAQDMAFIVRRLNFQEIFPLWFQLGQMLPPLVEGPFGGTLALLEPCTKAITSRSPETILAPFETLYRAGFEGIMSPRLQDNEHQGLGVPEASEESATPLLLLVKGYSLIRSLFVQFSGNQLSLLPALPPQFHAGRLLDVQLPGLGTLDLEWSKKEVRRCVIRCEQSAEFILNSKNHKSYRINKKENHSTGALISLAPGEWSFDQFK